MKKVLFTLLLIFAPVSSAGAQIFVLAPAPAPIKILLVPGHDNEIWGARYGNIKEADMNLRLATELFNVLKKDKRFEVHITRDSVDYTKEFADYFTYRAEDIKSFRQVAREARAAAVASGSFVKVEGVSHNLVNADTSQVLYGINMWADENKMDAVIHIHFNDIPRPTIWSSGKYRGFAIYMPEGQMVNAKESAQLAGNIFAQLNKKYISSTYKKEQGGLVTDQNLIALGSNGSLLPSVRSILIEYGYIYRFGNTTMRHQFYTSAANLTAVGIKNYFFGAQKHTLTPNPSP